MLYPLSLQDYSVVTAPYLQSDLPLNALPHCWLFSSVCQWMTEQKLMLSAQ